MEMIKQIHEKFRCMKLIKQTYGMIKQMHDF